MQNVATHILLKYSSLTGGPHQIFSMKKIHFFGAFAGPEILQAGLFCVNQSIMPRQSDSESHKKFTKRGTHTRFWKVLVHNWWPFGIIYDKNARAMTDGQKFVCCCRLDERDTQSECAPPSDGTQRVIQFQKRTPPWCASPYSHAIYSIFRTVGRVELTGRTHTTIVTGHLQFLISLLLLLVVAVVCPSATCPFRSTVPSFPVGPSDQSPP